MNADEQKLFLEHVYALHNDPVLLSIFQKYGIGCFRRSSVLRNFDRFLEKVDFSGDCCVEIGTRHGLTALVLSRRFNKVISIDNTPNELKHEILKFTGIKNVEYIDCKDNAHKAEIIKSLKFDAAYVDADHAKDTYADFELVQECGRVLFDEFWPDQPAVWRLVNSLYDSGEVQSDWNFAVWVRREMDRFIRDFAGTKDDDLIQCTSQGVAYQRDMSKRIKYDEPYYENYRSLEGSEIANKLNEGRVALVNKYVGSDPVLDIGVGSCEFIRSRNGNTCGYDINPRAIKTLKYNGLWSDDFSAFRAFTFWDVIEHVCNPDDYFKKIKSGSHLFTSLPIFDDLKDVRKSKHFKPGEHLYYWTERGFIDWMKLYGFVLLETSDFETRAGREGITSFAFRRN